MQLRDLHWFGLLIILPTQREYYLQWNMNREKCWYHKSELSRVWKQTKICSLFYIKVTVTVYNNSEALCVIVAALFHTYCLIVYCLLGLWLGQVRIRIITIV